MIDPTNYDQVETLKNGTAVRIRSVRADDKNRFIEMFRNLEAESIYTRFFHRKKTLTDAELKTVTEVDFENVVALAVTIGEGENETIIGAGRYVAFEDASAQRTAEVAFTVEEDYHGQGMAGLLLRHLTFIAVEKGESQFEAEVLSENKAMMAVFSRSGLPMKRKVERGVVHVTLSLRGVVT
jgi:RimJ/RimL family protein N-acetyltransferase